jgi:hypothetical protein
MVDKYTDKLQLSHLIYKIIHKKVISIFNNSTIYRIYTCQGYYLTN